MNSPMPPVLGENVSQQGIAHAISLCEAHGSSHHTVLIKAVGVGRIAMTALTDRLSRPNINALNKTKRPVLVLIGDDDAGTTGPLGWAAVEQLASWARCALIHASGADPQSYAMAVAMAEASGRVLLIETASDVAEAWVEALRHANVRCVALLPTNGVHPVEDAA